MTRIEALGMSCVISAVLTAGIEIVGHNQNQFHTPEQAIAFGIFPFVIGTVGVYIGRELGSAILNRRNKY